MKNTSNGCCPGCSRHCKPGCARCKYGRKYFEQQKACPCACVPCGSCASRQSGKKELSGWKKKVSEGGLIWRMLMMSRRIKKLLKKSLRNEEEILNLLGEEERECLSGILRKLEEKLD